MSAKRNAAIVVTFLLISAVWMSFAPATFAHCDTLSGPVVTDAKAALEKEDLTPVLKWVKPADEKDIHNAFEKTLAVRSKGDEAKELADMYFFETLVRIHRAGEGAHYTGLKNTPVEPIIAEADEALESGSADELTKAITGHAAEGIRARFEKALETKKHAGESVEAGREYVEAYVQYTHYIEGLHNSIAGPADHHGEAQGTVDHHSEPQIPVDHGEAHH